MDPRFQQLAQAFLANHPNAGQRGNPHDFSAGLPFGGHPFANGAMPQGPLAGLGGGLAGYGQHDNMQPPRPMGPPLPPQHGNGYGGGINPGYNTGIVPPGMGPPAPPPPGMGVPGMKPPQYTHMGPGSGLAPPVNPTPRPMAPSPMPAFNPRPIR